jgi:hypothetical protein
MGIAVPRLQGELRDSDTSSGVQIDRIAGLDVPTRLDESRVDLLAGAFFWCVEVDQG